MFKTIVDNSNPNSLASKFRKNRLAFFFSLISRLNSPITILDVGGTDGYWKTMNVQNGKDIKVTLLNLSHQIVSSPYVESVVGDARNLQFENASFDIVFSNSVIEHVGDYEDQRKMAEEVRRVGKRYFVQTPNNFFFIEPHFVFPFFQFLPLPLKIWLLMHFKMGWFEKESDSERAKNIVQSIRLLSKKEMAALFPDSSLYEEKVLGMTKSYIAYSGWD